MDIKVKGQFEETQTTQTTTTELQFLTPEELGKLKPLAEKWGEKSLKEQVLLLNKMARKLNGDKVSPLAVKTREGEIIYPHVTYLSKLSSFSPVLALPHSGQGFSTVDRIELRHPAVLSYEITVGECGNLEIEDEEEVNVAATATKEKVAFAKAVVKLKWTPKGGKLGADSKPYRVGETIPDGSMMYYLQYPDGRKVAGPRLSKEGFSFSVQEVPSLKDENFTVVGNPETATRVKVALKVHGQWQGYSTAEKFAAMLTKLCIDKMPLTETPEDLLKGGILLYQDEAEKPLEDLVEEILKGEIKPCPLTDTGSGQETQKGASTAEPCAAWLKALTGKGVLRPETQQSQNVNGKPFDMGWLVWDVDEFVEMRKLWNEASIHPGIWVRWVDDWMKEVLQEATKKKKEDFFFEPCIHGGWYVFHRTEVRAELAPLTMETSTQKENLSSSSDGSMFWELVNVLGQL